MALYQYRCPTCHTTFDRFVKVDERDQPQDCPAGHAGARRLLQSYAITQADRRKTFRQAVSRTPGKHFT